jgi:hypothetical protein
LSSWHKSSSSVNELTDRKITKALANVNDPFSAKLEPVHVRDTLVLGQNLSRQKFEQGAPPLRDGFTTTFSPADGQVGNRIFREVSRETRNKSRKMQAMSDRSDTVSNGV